MSVWWALCACQAELSEEETEPPSVWPVSALWDALVETGDRLTLAPVVVTSPRTQDQRLFFGADPAGGPRSGVAIVLGAALAGWPPPVGTELQLSVTVVRSGEAPVVELLEEGDAEILGTGSPPAPAPYLDDAGLQLSLVQVPDLTVTSRPDPLGWADTDGPVPLGGRFGLTPGWRRSGTLTGILADGRLHARTEADWTGAWPGDPPVPARLADLDALPPGTPVLLEDLSLATPWSRDARWAVAQDAQGRGVWLDAEAWGLWAVSSRADLGTWLAEARPGYLRIWDPPLLEGTRPPLLTDTWRDGALLSLSIETLGAPDPYGERVTGEGIVLDDRLVDLGALSVPAEIIGAVRIIDAEEWMAPLE